MGDLLPARAEPVLHAKGLFVQKQIIILAHENRTAAHERRPERGQVAREPGQHHQRIAHQCGRKRPQVMVFLPPDEHERDEQQDAVGAR